MRPPERVFNIILFRSIVLINIKYKFQNMMKIPSPKGNVKEITGKFEFETYVSKEDLVRFLKELSEQIEKGNEISLTFEEGIIKLSFTEPIKLEIDFDGLKRKLKIELEFRQYPKIKLSTPS
uniref:Amphi-Trp domain-containing protein n=1 Tax=Geoglobus ahangari TaxID=113653 RepID=A0A7C3YEB5_9EURY